MDAESQKTLDVILSMDKDSLTEDQKGFLLARRSYLNDEQRKRYADLIEAHEDAVKKGTVGKKAEEKPLSKMKLEELKAKAEGMEIEVTEEDTKATLIEKIEEALEE